MDSTLEITGSSKISTSTLVRISKLELKSSSNNVETSSNIDGNIKGVMETIFTGNGTATFTGTVVNMGSTEAILSTINLMNESNNSSPTCITISIDGLKVGDKLTPSQEQNFTVTVTNTCTEASTKMNEFSLSYIPVNPGEGTTTIDERITNLENQITALQTENQQLKEKDNELQGKVTKDPIGIFPLVTDGISYPSVEDGRLATSYFIYEKITNLFPLNDQYKRRYELVIFYSTENMNGYSPQLKLFARSNASDKEFKSYNLPNVWGPTSVNDSCAEILDKNFDLESLGIDYPHLAIYVINESANALRINGLYIYVYDE